MSHRATRTERGYSNRWYRYRSIFLQQHPVCEFCKKQGRVRAAAVIDHIIPHRGDERLFWDPTNHQALCYHCHDSVKQGQERRGYDTACGEDGWPLDPRHPANRDREV